jgi:hypothetical protein
MPWIASILGAVVSRMLSWSMIFFSYVFAKRIAIASGFIAASAVMFLGMAAAIKAIVLTLRVTMPPILSASTYFLPANINFFIAALITVRMTHFIWRWSQANLAVYANVGGHGEGLYF